MGWRFRRSIRILPGIHANFGKRGFTSWSFGGRGFRTNVSSARGVRNTVGIPGTGLSYTSQSPRHRSTSTSYTSTGAPTPRLDPERFRIIQQPLASSAGKVRLVLLTSAAFLLAVGTLLPKSDGANVVFVVAGVLAVTGIAAPSRKRLEAAEDARCQSLARQMLDERLSRFKAALEPGAEMRSAGNILALKDELGLTDDEVGRSTVATLHGAVEFADFQRAVADNGDALRSISGHEQVVAPDSCYYAGAALYDKRGDNDPDGTLYLADSKAMFVAPEGVTVIPWSKVMSVSRTGSMVAMQRRDRQTPNEFYLAPGAALIAEYIALRLARSVGVSGPRSVSNRTKPASTPSSRPATEPAGSLTELPACDGGFGVAIVGESYAQSALKALAGPRRQRGEDVVFTAVLVPDPDNPHDSNAVRVNIHNGAHVGYLSREDAVSYRASIEILIARHDVGLCRAKLIGGILDKPSIGVVLDLADPATVLSSLKRDGRDEES
jgi:hypothetical protein